MTTRERREARAERLREWADKREAKAATAQTKINQIADMIPMGQPILIGHHSEGRHRRDLGRIDSGMRALIEHGDKARDFRSRAASIEAATERSIFTDDENAVEALEARIAEREAERDRIKAYNVSCRKGNRDVSLLDKKQQADLVSIARYSSYQLGKNGEMPAYALSNLSGTISRDRKRLVELRHE